MSIGFPSGIIGASVSDHDLLTGVVATQGAMASMIAQHDAYFQYMMWSAQGGAMATMPQPSGYDPQTGTVTL